MSNKIIGLNQLYPLTQWEKDIEDAMREGFKQYITKPIDTVSFIFTLQKFLKNLK